jgi:MYXO-CTERM domain-containing protein
VDVTLPATETAHTVAVAVTDGAGNRSIDVASATVIVDLTPPDAPVVAAVTSPTKYDPVVIGVTAEAGATVVLVVDGVPRTTLLPTAQAGDQYTFELPLADGPHTVEATVTDAAGNVNLVPSNTVAFEVAVAGAAPPPAGGAGGGCGCAQGGASAPEGLTLLAIGLATFRRRRAPIPANLRGG